MTENIEQQPTLLDEYDKRSQAAASEFKNAVSAAQERQERYGVDATEAIDQAKAKLDETAASIQSDYETRLGKELEAAKQHAMTSGAVSKAEASAAESFISDVQLKLAISSADSVTQLMDSMADAFTGKQRAYVLKRLAGELAAAGVDVRALSDKYTDPDATAAYGRIQQLEALRTEDAALAVTNIRRTHPAFKQ